MSLADLTADLREMARLTARAEKPEELLERGLEWLARIAPYDLATVFTLDGELLTVRAARGVLSPAVKSHQLALSDYPSIRRAIDERRARAFTEHDHAHGDGDPFDGVLGLPDGHSCMVAPLCAAGRTLGILALDRTVCEPYPPGVVSLVEVFAHLLAVAMENAEQRQRLEQLAEQQREQVRLLEADVAGDSEGVFADSRSPVLRRLARQARQVAVTDTPVLILGETGTGKERLARDLHRWSRRAQGPFVTVNCAAIPAGLLESTLFGHKKGAFTGASAARQGRFVVASGGTLLLDEVGELPLEMQAKLLRILQEGALTPVGADHEIKVDVRVLAATHVELQEAVAAGAFREDLYYRLEVFPLHLPPLRERREDLPVLCAALLAQQARRTGRSLTVHPDALTLLAERPWPGNIRQLANALERAVILAPPKATALGPELFGAATPSSTPQRLTSPSLTLDDVQRQHIARVLKETGGKIYGDEGAAAILGMKPTTLQSRMKKLGVARLY
jgi:formate hydrogenlyase transcriptional activator